ncbi:Anti-sigma regulatory factor (Ser/Thr protein kinase) [Actinopolymorpha cephalotaxi]|uniref:Anti-sigma regulatory factor (Ser/Thr protein kinase) n=1 Tax=Actinopolymorpha cephalotaxi TaxID=504797 RepID=A0A1I2NHE4_9ACTN|nr:sensor histidine kinase [Actinopolymorpha cephalotaxi]NYH85607.1 anti-sigma regulatory factor (Ser/Thr protein kinase) [Actinopolymorpha cephalotaxi]SFG00886.1 Anti-sigma regulatory factor (Ser/Thr protein kinase) [Actinopolymorpha cephalotaxi]
MAIRSAAVENTSRDGRLVHEALFYRDPPSLSTALLPRFTDAFAAGRPVAVVVRRSRTELLQSMLGSDAARVRWLDMAREGRNPTRLIAAVLGRFADQHPDRRVLVVGEPMWPERPRADYAALVAHEALINVAFAGRALTVICPYEVSTLASHVLQDAARTHPTVVTGEDTWTSLTYDDPVDLAMSFLSDLPEPEGVPERLTFGAYELARVRELVSAHAVLAGLGSSRRDDLVLAVNEVATNTLVHAGAPGVLRVWRETGRLVCEVSDHGQVSDPLIGRHPAPPTSRSPQAQGGRGLLLVNELCDLVQIATRSGATSGTTVRMHMIVADD